MLRNFFLTSFLFLVVTSAQSQVLISLLLGDKLNSDKLEFGLDGGVNLSKQTIYQSKGLPTFNLGFYFDFKLSTSLKFHTGVIVKSNVGADGIPVYLLNEPSLDPIFENGKIERNLSYFYVPALLRYTFKNNFNIEAGPQIGLLHKAYDIFSNKINDQEVTYKNDIRDELHPLDLGITTGMGYRLMHGKGMHIAIRYYYGLVDVVMNDTRSSVANRSLYFTVGIPIGAAKSNEKQAP